MIREICVLCGEDLDEQRRRCCDCRPKPATHLGRVVLAATRVAGPSADLDQLRRVLRAAAFHLRDRKDRFMTTAKPTTTVVESRSNRLGIEVRLERSGTRCLLRAYRLGELAAERALERVDRMTLGKTAEILDRSASAETRAALLTALDEGVRVVRDGRGLCEAA